MVQCTPVSYIVKIALTGFVMVLVPVYWCNYGPQNFLWFSDIGLFLTVGALWLESPLLISIAVIGILPIEAAWNIDFFVQLFTGYNLIAMANYMFDSHYTLFLRGLSLFHVITPLIWLWYLFVWGYDRRALWYAIPLIWVVLLLTYLITDPQANMNWVFSPHMYHWNIPSLAWLVILMTVPILVVVLPIHALLKHTVKSAH